MTFKFSIFIYSNKCYLKLNFIIYLNFFLFFSFIYAYSFLFVLYLTWLMTISATFRFYHRSLPFIDYFFLTFLKLLLQKEMNATVLTQTAPWLNFLNISLKLGFTKRKSKGKMHHVQ